MAPPLVLNIPQIFGILSSQNKGQYAFGQSPRPSQPPPLLPALFLSRLKIMAIHMNRYQLIVSVMAVSLLQGCASIQMVAVDYEPTAPITPVRDLNQPIKLGIFDDARGTDSRWVGTVRGGYGNVLYRLITDAPTSEVVRKAMEKALSSRSINIASNSAFLSLEGEIARLDCNYFFNREAHAHILVKIVSQNDQATVFSHTYRTDNTEPGIGAGIFCDIDYLAGFLSRTLNETIDKMCSDPAFLDALHWNKSRQAQSAKEIDKRLLNLETLRSKRLITESEYKAKRQQILDEL